MFCFLFDGEEEDVGGEEEKEELGEGGRLREEAVGDEESEGVVHVDHAEGDREAFGGGAPAQGAIDAPGESAHPKNGQGEDDGVVEFPVKERWSACVGDDADNEEAESEDGDCAEQLAAAFHEARCAFFDEHGQSKGRDDGECQRPEHRHDRDGDELTDGEFEDDGNGERGEEGSGGGDDKRERGDAADEIRDESDRHAGRDRAKDKEGEGPIREPREVEEMGDGCGWHVEGERQDEEHEGVRPEHEARVACVAGDFIDGKA